MAAAPLDQVHYQAVAAVYMAAQRGSNPAPGKAVARHFGVSEATASVWTRASRSLGFITTPAPYRPTRASAPDGLPQPPHPPPPRPPVDSSLAAPLETTDDVRISPAGPDEAFGGPGDMAQDLDSLRRLAARVGRVVDAETSADRLVAGARVLAALTSQIRAAERALRDQRRYDEALKMAQMAAEKAEKERMDSLNDEFARMQSGTWVDS